MINISAQLSKDGKTMKQLAVDEVPVEDPEVETDEEEDTDDEVETDDELEDSSDTDD